MTMQFNVIPQDNMGIHRYSIARMVVTKSVTVTHIVNARPANLVLFSCRTFHF